MMERSELEIAARIGAAAALEAATELAGERGRMAVVVMADRDQGLCHIAVRHIDGHDQDVSLEHDLAEVVIHTMAAVGSDIGVRVVPVPLGRG